MGGEQSANEGFQLLMLLHCQWTKEPLLVLVSKLDELGNQLPPSLRQFQPNRATVLSIEKARITG
jgi:hypothetical protein